MKFVMSLQRLSLLASVAEAACKECSGPTFPVPVANTLNGSYYGERIEQSYTENFLDIPYAQPPTGHLRLQLPQSLNTTWSGKKNATEYGYGCVGLGEDTQVAINNFVNEDCLTMNVVRPAGYDGNAKLPVLVWIHGGGFAEGSSRDRRYNLTSIVEQSAKIGKPIIAASFNYRLLAYGFARSKQILDAGLTNLGLKDQRLALHWVQENIAGFGGDPEKVTIWGESAGGFSVGYHLLAYNGRDDKLFRAAISESGQPIGMGLFVPSEPQIEAAFNNFTLRAGCETHPDKLACLRSLSPEEFLAAHNNQVSGFWPSVDGDFIARPTLDQLSTGNFVKVPYLAGDNSDEGTAFSPFGVNSDSQLFDVLSQFGLDKATVSELMALYPNNPAQLIPNSHPAQFNSTIGLQWKRIATIVTDALMSVPRKLMIEAMAKKSTAPIFTYRFNTIPNGVEDVWSVTHFMEMAFVLNNRDGLGYTDVSQPYLGPNPFEGKPQSYLDLADLMSRMWVSFAHDLDPNCHPHHGPNWKRYKLSDKKQIVFDAVNGVHLENVYALRPNATRFIMDHLWKQVRN